MDTKKKKHHQTAAFLLRGLDENNNVGGAKEGNRDKDLATSVGM